MMKTVCIFCTLSLLVLSVSFNTDHNVILLISVEFGLQSY